MKIAFLTRKDKISTPGFSVRRDTVIEFMENAGNEVSVFFGRVSPDMLINYDLGFSFYYPFILGRRQFNAPKFGTLNGHSGYLPYCRGAAPNVFAIAYNLPAGFTIHYIDRGVDTGPIVSQVRIKIEPDDTGESLYFKLLDAGVKLIGETWPLIDSSINSGKRPPSIPQIGDFPTYRMSDLLELDDLDKQFGDDGRKCIEHLLSRSFPPHEAMYFTEDGIKYYVRVSIEKAEPLSHR